MSLPLKLSYNEEHSLQLTSATTVYSSARRAQYQSQRQQHQQQQPRDLEQKDASGFSDRIISTVLATETHSIKLEMDCQHHEFDHDDDYHLGTTLTTHTTFLKYYSNDTHLPFCQDRICVGFDTMDEWQVSIWIPRSKSVPDGGNGAGGKSATNTTTATIFDDTVSVATSHGVSNNSTVNLSASIVSTTTLPIENNSANGMASFSTLRQLDRRSSSNNSTLNTWLNGASRNSDDILSKLHEVDGSTFMYQATLIISAHYSTREQNHNLQQYATLELNYRPLASTLCRFCDYNEMEAKACDDDYGDNDKGCRFVGIGLWAGSADDCKLRLYVVHANDDTAFSLEKIDVISIHESAFSFESPVMAIDCCCISFTYGNECIRTGAEKEGYQLRRERSSVNPSLQILAVATQDGTVRLISYHHSKHNATNKPYRQSIFLEGVQSSTFIVDGPIVTLSLRAQTIGDRDHSSTYSYSSSVVVRCVVGSLCGYACEVIATFVDRTSSPIMTIGKPMAQWHGPYMIISGLRNTHLHCEDSVLAVNSITLQLVGQLKVDLVAVGTHAGRIFVYGTNSIAFIKSYLISGKAQQHRTPDDTALMDKSPLRYELLWSCQLAYSIHGIIWLPSSPTTLPESQNPTDRLFDMDYNLVVTTRRNVHVFDCDAHSTVVYSACLARERLQKLKLVQHEHSNKQKTILNTR